MKKSQSRKRRARQKPTDGVTPERARRLIDDLTRERELMDAAGFLWGNQPYVVWRVEKQPQVKADAALRKYPAKFTLQRSESPNANPETAGLIKRNTDDHPHEELWRAMYIEKLTSDFARRWQKAIRSGPLMDRLYNKVIEGLAARGCRNRREVKERAGQVLDAVLLEIGLREGLTELAWTFDVEDLTRIFSAAEAAGDYEFIKKIIDARARGPSRLEPPYLQIVRYWHGFHLIRLEQDVPPLKYWSDQAACEFVVFDSHRDDVSIENYRQCKKRLGCRSEKPTLVSYAEPGRNGAIQHLVCKR